MRFGTGSASLVAMTMFASMALAQESQPTDTQQAAPPPAEQTQVEQTQAEQPATLPKGVLKLINDARPSRELQDDELKARTAAASKSLKLEGLPDDVRQQIQALLDSDKAELDSRASAQAPTPEVEQTAPAATTETEQPTAPTQPEQQAQPEQPATPAVELPEKVLAILNDTRALADLPDDELQSRAKAARMFSKESKLPDDVRSKLATVAEEARAIMKAREQQAGQPPAAPAEPPAPPAKAAETPEQVTQPETSPPADQAVAPPPAPPPVVDKVEVQQLDGNAGEPESEKTAKAYLADKTDVQQMSDEDLRKRLDGIRELMTGNTLSAETEKAVREKLSAERDVLRNRVARQKAEAEAAIAAAPQPQNNAAPVQEQGNPPKKGEGLVIKPNITIVLGSDIPRRQVLRDRRNSDELADVELQRRIEVYRDVERDNTYDSFDPETRNYWRETMRRDRETLRRRMIEERDVRRDELRSDRRFEVTLGTEYAGDEEDIPEDIFAAEVEDGDIEKALVAPPRRKILRKVRIEDIANQPELRETMTRIEVDTIRFGFNEAFVREEEVDNLDAIAAVIERVLVKYPHEVFLIEGHTDAVGSDEYNLKLSKARAEAVKKALTAYYVIPGRNLQTIGLGERYLKIPTADAEGENRRVSISRATPLIGEVE